nr:MAG TPA: hypothetical protein [Caudoviricetes sp.]
MLYNLQYIYVSIHPNIESILKYPTHINNTSRSIQMR